MPSQRQTRRSTAASSASKNAASSASKNTPTLESAPASSASKKPASRTASNKKTRAAEKRTNTLKEPEPLTEEELATLRQLQKRNQGQTSIAQAEKDNGMRTSKFNNDMLSALEIFFFF